MFQLYNVNVGWSLGLMLNASNIIPPIGPTETLNMGVFVLLVILFVIFIGIAVAFACHAKQTQEKKTQYRKLSTYGSI